MAKHRQEQQEDSAAVQTDADRERSLQLSRETAAGNGDAPAKPVESKAQRFTRLARMRQPKLDKAVNALLNLANTAQYEYTPDQAAKLVQQVESAAARIKSAFVTGEPDAAAPWLV